MSKRKKIFHKPEEQIPSADDILNYLSEESSPVPPSPKKSSPSGGAAKMERRKKMEMDESSADDSLSLDKKNKEEEKEKISPSLSSPQTEISVGSKGFGGVGGNDLKKNKKKYELEKSMLSEPLVSDAVEGYALIADRKKARNLIEEINQNISQQTRRKNNRAVLMRIASILLLMLMVSGGSYYIFDQWSEVNMTAVSNEKSNSASEPFADSINLSNNKTEEKKELDRLAIEMEPSMQEVPDNRMLPATKPGNSDAIIHPQGNYGPVKEEAAKSNGMGYNSSELVLDESEKKEDVLAAPKTNAPLERSVDSLGLAKDQLSLTTPTSPGFNSYTDDGEQVKIYKFSEDKKTSSETVSKEKKSKQRAKGFATPAYRKESSDQLEENSPAGESKKGFLLEDGIRLYNQGKFVEAKEIFSGVLLTQPSNQEAIFYSGMSDYQTKLYDRALSNLSKVTSASRRYDEARWNISLIYIETGRKDEAITLWKILSQSNSSYSEKAFEKLKEYSK